MPRNGSLLVNVSTLEMVKMTLSKSMVGRMRMRDALTMYVMSLVRSRLMTGNSQLAYIMSK
jgi:hypothetical protein